jgi:Na+:H+ antiporter, NhaA family
VVKVPSKPLRSAPIHKLTGPVRRFLQIEAMSGAVLLLATVVALALANGGFAQVMHDFWHTKVKLGVGTWDFSKSLEFWINDGLMTIFFFVVGLEIKREIMVGELRSVRKASLPVIAALGGMLVPAGVYLAFGHTGDAQRGWGIPMATDIAFVVGLLAAFGKRVPFGLKIFLLSLAIADDIGAILVIAVAYTEQLNAYMLGAAGSGIVLMVLMNRLGVRPVLAYVVVGAVVWYATYVSGIHPTIAGVAIGLLTPHTAWLRREALALALDDVSGQMNDRPEELELAPADVAMLREAAREVVSPLQRLEDRLHPWVAFVIMPLFALANAGVVVNVSSVGHPVALAVAAGLLLGKVLGIVLFSWLAVKLKLAMLPSGVTWMHIVAGGFLGGIGFTMSLFVSALAFVNSPELLADAKTGVLLGSALSAIAGAALLAMAKKSV